MSPQQEDKLSSPSKSPTSSSTLSEKDSSETVSSSMSVCPQLQESTPKSNRIKEFKYVDFEGIKDILSMVVDEDVLDIYL